MHVFSAPVALAPDAIALVIVQALFLYYIASVWGITAITNDESLQWNSFVFLLVFVTLNVRLQKIVHLQEKFISDQRIMVALDQLAVEQVMRNVTAIKRISENLSKSAAINADTMLLKTNRNLTVRKVLVHFPFKCLADQLTLFGEYNFLSLACAGRRIRVTNGTISNPFSAKQFLAHTVHTLCFTRVVFVVGKKQLHVLLEFSALR